MRLPTISFSLAALAAATCAPSLSAQWVSYTNETGARLSASASLVANDTQEKDYGWADLDQDGDVDLVIVRKSPFTSGGHFPNVLLMNEGGVLTDRSSTLTTSTVPGSSGFLDATNDRDVEIADVDGDGWLDVITCTTLTAGMPEYIRANRVYINQGMSGGVWQGLLFDDANRIDDAAWGNGEHRFCAVSAGDIDGDGDEDLYYGDYEQGGSRSIDVNDRLLINDGSGYFTDQSATRMSLVMLESSFGMQVKIADMNGDGKLDILKDDALNTPQAISVSYNDGAVEGQFSTYDLPYGNAPYHFATGDLNNDNRLDIIVSDDGQDRYILNLGNNAAGLATFSPTIAFTYSGGGSDDGFGGNNLIADLDNDGWNDAIVTDVDVDIAGCSRRTHIYRNLGNAPNVTLQEQIVSGQVVGGITAGDLQGTHDIAVFDINGDGFLDMVVGRCTGTQIYINDPPVGLTFSFVGGLPSMIAPNTTQAVTVDASGIGGITALAGTGQLFYSINNAPFVSVAMSDSGPGQFQGALPAMPNCADGIRFYVSAQGSDSSTYSDPPSAPAGFYSAIAAVSLETLYQNNFEVNSTGWTVVDDASLSSGSWEVAAPNGTTSAGQFVSSDDDAEAGAATMAFVTQNGAVGGNAGTTDIDGGPTDLISPVIDMAGTDGFVSYQRWFYGSGADALTVSVSNNGTTWVTVETVLGGGNNQWLANQFRVGDFVTPTATIQVRFRADDVGGNSLCDAGVDVFKVDAFSCDYCQPTVPLTTVGAGTLSMCGEVLSAATPSTTLAIENMPASTNGLLFFDVFLNPVTSPWNSSQLISVGPIVLGPTFADGGGDFIVPLNIGGLLPPGWALYMQSAYIDSSLPGGVGVTNGIKIEWN